MAWSNLRHACVRPGLSYFMLLCSNGEMCCCPSFGVSFLGAFSLAGSVRSFFLPLGFVALYVAWVCFAWFYFLLEPFFFRCAVADDKRNVPRGSRSGGRKEVQLHGAHVAGHNPGHLWGRPEVWSPGRSSRAAPSSLIQATRIVTCVGFGLSGSISGPKA